MSWGAGAGLPPGAAGLCHLPDDTAGGLGGMPGGLQQPWNWLLHWAAAPAQEIRLRMQQRLNLRGGGGKAQQVWLQPVPVSGHWPWRAWGLVGSAPGAKDFALPCSCGATVWVFPNCICIREAWRRVELLHLEVWGNKQTKKQKQSKCVDRGFLRTAAAQMCGYGVGALPSCSLPAPCGTLPFPGTALQPWRAAPVSLCVSPPQQSHSLCPSR